MSPRDLGTVSPIGHPPDERSAPGTLVIIGGAEAKRDEPEILREVVRSVGSGRLLVTAVASRHPREMVATYREAFAELGLHDVEPLHIHDRGEARSDEITAAFDGATGIFFTGGDQLRIASHIADTPMHDHIRDMYERGGVVAGTSAGASAMGDTMMVAGPSDRSHRLGDLLKLAQGLGLVDLIIDQHFAQRGRMGRLLGAVAQNPGSLALGIDEDTAVVVEGGDSLRVIGEGTVYVVDGEAMTHTNVGEAEQYSALSAYDLALHLLARGDRFDMEERRPRAVEDARPLLPDEIREERRERRRGGDRRGRPRREADRRADHGEAGGRRDGERRKGRRRDDGG